MTCSKNVFFAALLLGLVACSPNRQPGSAGGTHFDDHGNEGSGGGSGYAADFTNIGYRAVKLVDTVPNFPVSSAAFQAVVESTRVEFVDRQLTDPSGLQVDALNFPERKLIRVNIKRWDGLFSYPAEKYQLVVHEYLGIMKVNDAEYRNSSKVLDGGIRFWGIKCTYQWGNLDWYLVDTTGGGDFKVEARFSSDQGVLGNVVIGVSGTGIILSWADLQGMETAYFPEFDQLNTPGNFQKEYFLQDGFDGDNTPLFKSMGNMDCAVQKMEPFRP